MIVVKEMIDIEMATDITREEERESSAIVSRKVFIVDTSDLVETSADPSGFGMQINSILVVISVDEGSQASGAVEIGDVITAVDGNDFSSKSDTDFFYAVLSAKKTQNDLEIEVNGGPTTLARLQGALEEKASECELDTGDNVANEAYEQQMDSSMITLAEILVDFLQKFSLFVTIEVPWPSLFKNMVKWLAVFTFKFDLMFPALSSLWIEYGILLSTLAIHPLMIAYMYFFVYAQTGKQRWKWEEQYAHMNGRDVVLIGAKWVVPVALLCGLSFTIAKAGGETFASYPIMIALTWSCLWLLFVLPNVIQAGYYRWCRHTHKDEDGARKHFWAALSFVKWRAFWFFYASSYLAPVKVLLQICYENASLKEWVIEGIGCFWLCFFIIFGVKMYAFPGRSPSPPGGGDAEMKHTDVQQGLRSYAVRGAAIGCILACILVTIMGIAIELEDTSITSSTGSKSKGSPERYFLLWLSGFTATPWTLAPPLILWHAAYACQRDVGIAQSHGSKEERKKSLGKYKRALKAKSIVWRSVNLEQYAPAKERGDDVVELGDLEKCVESVDSGEIDQDSGDKDVDTEQDNHEFWRSLSTKRHEESAVEALMVLFSARSGKRSGPSASLPKAKIVASSLCSFIQPFEPAYFWFKAFTIVERASLAGAIVLLQAKEHVDYQIGFSTAIVFAGLLTSVLSKPFIEDTEDRTDIAQRLSNSLTAIIAILIYSGVVATNTANVLLLIVFFATIAIFIGAFKPSRIFRAVHNVVMTYSKVRAAAKLTNNAIQMMTDEQLAGLVPDDVSLWAFEQRLALLECHGSNPVVLTLIGKTEALMKCLQDLEPLLRKQLFSLFDEQTFAVLFCGKYTTLGFPPAFFERDSLIKSKCHNSFKLTHKIILEELEQSFLAWPQEFALALLKSKHEPTGFTQRAQIIEYAKSVQSGNFGKIFGDTFGGAHTQNKDYFKREEVNGKPALTLLRVCWLSIGADFKTVPPGNYHVVLGYKTPQHQRWFDEMTIKVETKDNADTDEKTIKHEGNWAPKVTGQETTDETLCTIKIETASVVHVEFNVRDAGWVSGFTWCSLELRWA
jgi:hypothetical protein